MCQITRDKKTRHMCVKFHMCQSDATDMCVKLLKIKRLDVHESNYIADKRVTCQEFLVRKSTTKKKREFPALRYV